MGKIKEWVRAQYREAYCDEKGNLVAPKVDLHAFRAALETQRPESVRKLTKAIKNLDQEICSTICRGFPTDERGRFRNADVVRAKLLEVRPDLVDWQLREMELRRIETANVAAIKKKHTQKKQVLTTPVDARPSASCKTASSSHESSKKIIDDKLYQWIQNRYLESAFTGPGFIGWTKFQQALKSEKPQQADRIAAAIEHLRTPNVPYGIKHPDKIMQEMARLRKQQKALNQTPQATASKNQSGKKIPHQSTIGSLSNQLPGFKSMAGGLESPCPAPTTQAQSSNIVASSTSAMADQLANHINRSRLHFETPSTETSSSRSKYSDLLFSGESDDDKSSNTGTTCISTPDFALYSKLFAGKNKSSQSGGTTKGLNRDIEQAPLFSGDIVAEHAHDLVPQFGLLGCLSGKEVSLPASQVFLNTNAPLSTFICGVQGSGKSYTTACILENAAIPSSHLGQLERPVSTLVFSYGEWSSGGAGFNISEAAYLSLSSDTFPGHAVRRVTVLISPSNPAIKRLYAFKNFRIIPFKLKAKSLDISALKTLMCVDEKSTVPLYMAKVEAILRSIAVNSEDGSLDYAKFKEMLALERFNPDQLNMLEMRLNLLESFLDMTNNAPEPDFLPGEITIMDLSDAFISPSTACILFKLGLEQFLQGKAPGKLVVLDEAHKYMLNTPGSKILTDYLTRVIRLQRHLGTRMVISTQEPTVSTDLIALCSITIMHRFTSPAWYAALKKHINVMDGDDDIMHEIEGLETGEAFMYAPNAVLGKEDDGTLIKATGQLLKIQIRDRVTRDGGESIMAV